MDAIIRYTEKIPIWKSILGITAILIGVLGMVSLEIFGVVPFVLGFMLLKVEGSEIDLQSKTYRNIKSILGFNFGQWETLENPEYVSVFNTTEHITVRVITAETTNSFPIIVVNIFLERNKKITAYRTQDAKDAFDVASHIADALAIDVLDATVKNDFKWVDKTILREKGEIIYIE